VRRIPWKESASEDPIGAEVLEKERERERERRRATGRNPLTKDEERRREEGTQMERERSSRIRFWPVYTREEDNGDSAGWIRLRNRCPGPWCPLPSGLPAGRADSGGGHNHGSIRVPKKRSYVSTSAIVPDFSPAIGARPASLREPHHRRRK